MSTPDTSTLMTVALCTAAFIFLALRFKALTVSGTVSAVILGLAVISFAGVKAIWPLVLFLGGSVMLGRLETENSIRSDGKNGRPRDFMQVFSNGGIYGLAACIYAITQDYHFLICMGVSISISTCDTWSSEAGIRFSSRTFDPFRFRKVSPGVSGGISLAGTLTGILGAGIMSLMTCFLFDLISDHLLIFTGGITGMLLDSFMGSRLQKKYLDSQTNEWVDSAKTYSDEQGLSFVTNDMVNMLSNFITTAIFYFVA